MYKAIVYFLIITLVLMSDSLAAQHAIPRDWNEIHIESIRNDFARPPVHARTLYQVASVMYDAWAAYSDEADTYLLGKTLHGFSCPLQAFPKPADLKAAREEAISYAAYRMLRHRFKNSPGFAKTGAMMDSMMAVHGYDITKTDMNYQSGSPAALGNYIADCMINYGYQDGSNEINNYAIQYYRPVNPPIAPEVPGAGIVVNPNRWQPIQLNVFIDQAGNIFQGDTIKFQSPEWGVVQPFALTDDDLIPYTRDGNPFPVCLDPGPPPNLDSFDHTYQKTHALVAAWSSHLDPGDRVMWDISPASIGGLTSFPTDFKDYEDFYDLENGGDRSPGHPINPKTGKPYASQMVPRGDYARVLAEFWADGPKSETPPGHWFTIVNYVADHPQFERRFKGQGEIMDELEWYVKTYFILGGALHDAAITAWGIKGYYDSSRPLTAIRYMAFWGQSTDTTLPNYSPYGLPLIPGYIENVLPNDPLAGFGREHVGKIKLKAWRGPLWIFDPAVDVAGVDWILAENWWPYQRPTFVTPPFAGYVSGHSTYSRTAAEVMTLITGDEYFPGGMAEFKAEKNKYLVFEDGPSVDVTLQWATYRDASDQCSLSRIWGGIHPPVDDIPGRQLGMILGPRAFQFASKLFDKNNTTAVKTPRLDNLINIVNNPVAQDLIVDNHLTKNVTVDMYRLDGKPVYRHNIGIGRQEINTRQLTPGWYVVKFTEPTTQATTTKKIVKF